MSTNKSYNSNSLHRSKCHTRFMTKTLLAVLSINPTNAFITSPLPQTIIADQLTLKTPFRSSDILSSKPRTSNSQLNVLFGGIDSPTSSKTKESVQVQIKRTSPNSRRIGGEIIVPRPMDDVWAIITDYDNLSTHVPNLVESRRVNPSFFQPKPKASAGKYACRLYQRGAQKIVGFEFGASVTMDMVEKNCSQ